MGASPVTPHAPQFGGTLYFKVNTQNDKEKIEQALWDAALGDEYGFDGKDKSLLLREPDDHTVWQRNLTFRAPGDVLYVSAHNDDGLEKLGNQIAADQPDIAVLHHRGPLKDFDQTILTRSSGLQKAWETEEGEQKLDGKRLCVTA